MPPRRNRLVAWIASVAMALNAVWPLIALARPAVSITVALCSVEGAGHSIQLDLGKSQTEKAGEHCKLCVLGVDKAAFVQPCVPFDFSSGADDQSVEEKERQDQSRSFSSAHPRAPPQAS